MARRAISIACYVVSGFFFYTVCMLAFVDEAPPLAKLALTGGFCIPALIALGAGLACVRFQNWEREVGIVITSVGSFSLFSVLTMVCLFMSPEFKEFFPDVRTDVFGDYVSGIGCMAALGTGGILLIKTSKRNDENDSPRAG